MSPLHVRSAVIDDAPALTVLAEELGYPATAREVEVRLLGLDPADGVFVAELDGRLVGFVHVFEQRLLVTDPFAELGGLVVAPSARRHGVGRALLDRGTAWAREAGPPKLRIRAGSSRPEAHAFYPAAGCRFVKEQRVYERPT